jgi:hypothetical protein
MSQPVWRLVANLGDLEPLLHGGLFVYRDETGVYPPELERVTPYPELWPDTPYLIDRVVMEDCTWENGVLSDNEFHKDQPAWFAERFGSVASFIGMDEADARDHILSSDPVERARAWEAILSYFGPQDDSLYLSGDDAVARYERQNGETYDAVVMEAIKD